MYSHKFSETANMLNVAFQWSKVFSEDKNADKPTHSLTLYSSFFFFFNVFPSYKQYISLNVLRPECINSIEKAGPERETFYFWNEKKKLLCTCYMSPIQRGFALWQHIWEKLVCWYLQWFLSLSCSTRSTYLPTFQKMIKWHSGHRRQASCPKRKEIWCQQDKGFLFWKICNNHITENEAKKGTLPSMNCFTWIKCHKTFNVSSGIPQRIINKSFLQEKEWSHRMDTLTL